MSNFALRREMRDEYDFDAAPRSRRANVDDDVRDHVGRTNQHPASKR